MDNLEKIEKRMNGYISIAAQEKEQNQKTISELYDEQDRCEGKPQELAKKGDEQGYKEARLHLEYCSDRIAQLEQRNDDIDNKPLVSKQTHDDLSNAIWSEYIKAERECAAVFVEYAKKIAAAQAKMANVRNRCNSLLYTLNEKLYWTETVGGSGTIFRSSAYQDHIDENAMDKAVGNMYQGGSVTLAQNVLDIERK